LVGEHTGGAAAINAARLTHPVEAVGKVKVNGNEEYMGRVEDRLNRL